MITMAITPEDVLRMVETIPGRDGCVMGLYFGIDGERYHAREIAKILEIKSHHMAMRIIQERVRQLELAIGDRSVNLHDHVQAALMRRRAGLNSTDAPGR